MCRAGRVRKRGCRENSSKEVTYELVSRDWVGVFQAQKEEDFSEGGEGPCD